MAPGNLNSSTAQEVARLFVALALPKAIKAELQEAQRALARAAPGNSIRWSKPEQMHLTLRFLGNVDASRVERLIAALRSVGREFRPLTLRAAGIGFFPNAHRPRVVWAAVDDATGQLAAVQRAVQETTQEFTVEPPEANFVGHLTLGRIIFVSRPQSEGLAGAAADLKSRRFGEWEAAALDLMRSELSPAGALHTRVAEIGLGASSSPQLDSGSTCDNLPAN